MLRRLKNWRVMPSSFRRSRTRCGTGFSRPSEPPERAGRRLRAPFLNGKEADRWTFGSHVSARIEALSDRYFSRAIGANVTFGKGPHDNGFTCDIVAPVANGMVLKASGRAPEAKIAFEGAADKIEKQLRRYVSRLREKKGTGFDGTARAENAGSRGQPAKKSRRLSIRRSLPRPGSTFPKQASAMP